MKFKKYGIVVVLIMSIMMGSVTNSAYGMEEKVKTPLSYDNLITPLWTNINRISPYLSVDGTMVYPEVYVEAKTTKGVISGRMYLEKDISGTWTRVASWQLSGTSVAFLSKNYYGVANSRYRVKVAVTVDGEYFEATSKVCCT